MKRILVLLVALVLMALIWWAAHGERMTATQVESSRVSKSLDLVEDKQVEKEGSRPTSISDDARSQVTAIVPSQSEPVPIRLRVRSSTGLALAYIEFEVEDRLWRRGELVDERCTIDDLRLPRRVRAPGHLAALARHMEDDVVLEPDALLVLDGKGLRDCLPSIVPFAGFLQSEARDRSEWQTRIDGIVTSGYVDADHWAMAVRTLGTDADFIRDDEVHIQLEWSNHRIGYVEFFAHPGARGQRTLPCDDVGTLAPLDVEIVTPDSEPRGDIELAISPRDRGSEKSIVQKESWGQVQLNPLGSIFIMTRIGTGTSHVHRDGLVLGKSYLVRARDLASGAMGCAVIEHDGSARTLTLHTGIVVHGRLVTPDGSPPPRGDCFWSGANPQRKEVVWANHQLDLKTTADGEFELRGWGNLPWNVEGCTEVPAEIELSLQLIGFETLVRTFPVDATGHCECGEIKLSTRPPLFVLAAGNRISGDSLNYLGVRMSDHPAWFLSEVRGTRLADGSIALYPEIDSEDKASTVMFRGWKGDSENVPASALNRDAIQALIIDPDGSAGWAFRRAADGRYERVPEQTYTVDVDCTALPADRDTWTLGWSWSGMPQYVSSLTKNSVGERRQFDFSDGMRRPASTRGRAEAPQ
jgi:hypothetical protein